MELINQSKIRKIKKYTYTDGGSYDRKYHNISFTARSSFLRELERSYGIFYFCKILQVISINKRNILKNGHAHTNLENIQKNLNYRCKKNSVSN